MLPTDLEPEKVDQYPVGAFPPLEIEILDLRKGHLYDPSAMSNPAFVYAKDTQGKKWRVFERRTGIFKAPVKEA